MTSLPARDARCSAPTAARTANLPDFSVLLSGFTENLVACENNLVACENNLVACENNVVAFAVTSLDVCDKVLAHYKQWILRAE